MQIHIALYQWKTGITQAQIDEVLSAIEALSDKIPGIIEISTGKNTSLHHKGYTHVIMVRGEDEAAIEAYLQHPEHKVAAVAIGAIEKQGIGVDFSAG